MPLTGHKTRAVFERYNIVPGDLRDAARRLDAFALEHTEAASASDGVRSSG